MTTKKIYAPGPELMRIARAEAKAKETPWVDIMAGIAQGVINISEGMETIERGSQVHLAMIALVERFTAIENGNEALPPQFEHSAAHLGGYCRE